MQQDKKRSISQRIAVPGILLTVLCLGGVIILAGLIWFKAGLRPQPQEVNRDIFQGVTYIRDTRQEPRPMVIHIIKIDLRQAGISFLVTPGDPEADLPLQARTTSKFLKEFSCQLAINGDGFTPWYSRSLLSYYPRSGDPVAPLGMAASRGTIYSGNEVNHPVLYISQTNQARINTPAGKIYNAISGTPMVVNRGQPYTDRTNAADPATGELPADRDTPQPRTAVGLDKRSRTLILVIVDGRQPGFSQGATLAELADILIEHGAYTAMNLDGGGSSTLVVENTIGGASVLNSPIDQGIPGRQRPVGNHLCVFAPPLGDE
jgi:hypothetical protein